MKKILTFALTALLLGGFAFNANAQNRKASPAKAKASVEKKATVKKGNDTEKMVTDYEQVVDKCISLYKELQNVDKNHDKVNTKPFDQTLAKAETLKAKLEKAKDQMNRTQVDRYLKATEKLQQVYKKG